MVGFAIDRGGCLVEWMFVVGIFPRGFIQLWWGYPTSCDVGHVHRRKGCRTELAGGRERRWGVVVNG